jgi:uncharacterized protein YigE (DUF2233 family)
MKLSRRALFGLAALASGAIAAIAAAAFQHGEREPPPCAVREFEGSRFIVCTYNADRDELRLASRGPDGAYLRGFTALTADLGRDARRVRFAMNAGMYDDSGAPIGLYIADGDQQHALNSNDGPGNFHMLPNGVFWQDESGAVHADTTENYAAEPRAARWATQSGPMLVIKGELHPRIQHDGPSRNIRNGVGVRGDRTAYFVISSGVVSFGRFARFFRDELDCPNALFLDGSVSSLWAPEMERQDGNQELGPLVVVLARS